MSSSFRLGGKTTSIPILNVFGGSRYKANEITLTLDYQITVKGGGLEEPITFDGSFQEMETAGAFDECC